MTVRCKMQLTEIHSLNYGQKRYVFSAIYDNSIPEDQRFYKETPSGRFEMLVNNPKVHETYELGKHYYFDSVLVPENAKAV